MVADTDIDVKRVSLLDLIKPDRKEIVSRATIIAHLPEALASPSAARFADDVRKHLLAAHAASPGSPDLVSGFLLMFPSCIAAQLEGQADILNTFFRHVNLHSVAMGIESTRVISYTDDVERSYADWAAAFAGGDARGAVDTVDAAAAVNAASDINLQFIAFGQQLQPLRGPERKVALESISSFWQSMPKQDAILSLTTYDNAPTIGEFLALLDGPVDVDLESERVWPMPRTAEIK